MTEKSKSTTTPSFHRLRRLTVVGSFIDGADTEFVSALDGIFT